MVETKFQRAIFVFVKQIHTCKESESLLCLLWNPKKSGDFCFYYYVFLLFLRCYVEHSSVHYSRWTRGLPLWLAIKLSPITKTGSSPKTNKVSHQSQPNHRRNFWKLGPCYFFLSLENCQTWKKKKESLKARELGVGWGFFRSGRSGSSTRCHCLRRYQKRTARRTQLFPTVKKDGENSVQRQVFVGKPVGHPWLHPEWSRRDREGAEPPLKDSALLGWPYPRCWDSTMLQIISPEIPHGLANTRLSFGHIRPKKIPSLDHLLGDVVVFTDLHVAENVGQLLGYEHFDLIHGAT